MTNYLHPKNLAPMVLDQALNIYRENVILSANTDDYVFSEVDKKILGKAINGYRYRKGFTDTLKGIVYRVVQSVKAIFGKSDWNKALNVLNRSLIIIILIHISVMRSCLVQKLHLRLLLIIM